METGEALVRRRMRDSLAADQGLIWLMQAGGRFGGAMGARVIRQFAQGSSPIRFGMET